MFKILIRPLEVYDSETSWKWRNDPSIWEYTGNSPNIEITPEIERAWIENVLKDSYSKRFAITVNDKYIGNIQLTNITENDAQYHVFIGDKAYWGKGISYSATQQVIRYAKNVLRLQALYLFVNSNHDKAIRLYERSGFKIVSPDVKMELNLTYIIKPTVSVFCMVYNHEPFLKECLDGILMQRCTFDFEIVIGEDCSTDNSRAIILDYAQKYPGKFKLILHKINIGASENQRIVFENCKGKYIAMCEGDDYWTDPLKLQKQVDFLENNEDYILSFTKSKEFFEKESLLIPTIYPNNIDDLTVSQLLELSWFIRTATILFRREFLDLDFLEKINYGADYFIQLLLLNKGKFNFLNEETSVYRNHEGGISKSTSIDYIERRIQLIDNLKLFDVYSAKIYHEAIVEAINKIRIGIIDFSILNGHFRYIKIIQFKDVVPLISHVFYRFYDKLFKTLRVYTKQ